MGFKDKRSKTFIDSHAIYTRLKRNDPDIKRISENVVPAKQLAANLKRMESMYGTFYPVNAKHWGNGSSRPRNLNTDICHIPDIPLLHPTNINSFIDRECYCKDQAVRCNSGCIVASDMNTHNPPVLHSRYDDKMRYIKVSEAEPLQGWPRNITNGCVAGKLGLDRAARIKLLDNAVCNAHMREILIKWHTGPDPDDESLVASISQEALRSIGPVTMYTAELEAALKALSLSQL